MAFMEEWIITCFILIIVFSSSLEAEIKIKTEFWLIAQP